MHRTFKIYQINMSTKERYEDIENTSVKVLRFERAGMQVRRGDVPAFDP